MWSHIEVHPASWSLERSSRRGLGMLKRKTPTSGRVTGGALIGMWKITQSLIPR
jgi:hypothetical protein